MHIAVFSQYHTSPDCAATSRHYTFLRHLARRHRITLLTTNTWFHQRITDDFAWVPEGVELQAFEVAYANRMGRGQRLFSFGNYALRAIHKGISNDKPDLIWGISTPLTAAWAAAQVARRHRVPWVFEVQDLWPSFPIQMGAVPGRWLRQRLYALEKRLYQQAAHIITLSPDMSAHVRNSGISDCKITTLLNGTDFDLIAACPDPAILGLRRQYSLGERQVILYAGTYGRANDIPLLIEAAKRLQSRQDLCFVFTGDGYHATLLRAAAKKFPNIVVVPPQPRQHIFAWFRLARLSLIPFLDLPVLETNSPAKFCDSLAVGTPVIVTNQGWTRNFVEKYACGWYSPAADPAALAACVKKALSDPQALEEAGRRGKAIAALEFDRQQLAVEVERIFERVVEQELKTS